jgi:hypothetical protein
MSAPKVDVLAELSDVLRKHGASLFFDAEATLWIGGVEIGGVWHSEEGDGATLEFVDAESAHAALARIGGAA